MVLAFEELTILRDTYKYAKYKTELSKYYTGI